MFGRFLLIAALCSAATTSALHAQQATVACPEEFDQTYEWDDAGYAVNFMRHDLERVGIANDPGPNAPAKRRTRIIISGDDKVLIEESEKWLIELDDAAMLAGKRPAARARLVRQRIYKADLGDTSYREVESSDKPLESSVTPRKVQQMSDGRTRYVGSPIPNKPTLARDGSLGMRRLGVDRVLGFPCVKQQATVGGRGLVAEQCLFDLPRDCAVRRLFEPMSEEATLPFAGGRRVVSSRGRTVALRMGARGSAVDRSALLPPPRLRAQRPGARPVRPPPQPPSLPVCDCRTLPPVCTPAQRRACEQQSRPNN